jgi:hypothetical protein
MPPASGEIRKENAYQPQLFSLRALRFRGTRKAAAHLIDYETVIGVHVDKHHIHAHILFSSVNWHTGEKYHSNARTYYAQIRAISDRLCREHGLSVIEEPHGKSMSYIEWLRQSKGQPTYRSMLEADLKIAMEDANDIGHFYMLMEHMGYEIKHRNRLGFRHQGQMHFIFPEPRMEGRTREQARQR